MREIIFLIVLLSQVTMYSQKTELQVLMSNVFEESIVQRDSFIVVSESIEYSIGEFKLHNIQRRDLKSEYPDFPFDLITTNWKNIPKTNWNFLNDKKIKVFKKNEIRTWELGDKNLPYYQFSTPIFSSDRVYCVIKVFTNGAKSADNRNYVFRKTNDKWKEIFNYETQKIVVEIVD
ncbi:hypothetical protein SAMN05192540_3989 [Maribacter dokdonensis]|uniref:Uncharacterized protein n=1 Tax=Maribacter dokdonensis TaxID=320912 RepID=A0A1H4V285_9FLAO|nr:hypothetical protein [Maribacter dokdonensis]SEC75045.1 hypothetical protein SAMN05192540_3989 [Maribacter dokdonensis]